MNKPSNTIFSLTRRHLRLFRIVLPQNHNVFLPNLLNTLITKNEMFRANNLTHVLAMFPKDPGSTVAPTIGAYSAKIPV